MSAFANNYGTGHHVTTHLPARTLHLVVSCIHLN
jgi:hypothetical protein